MISIAALFYVHALNERFKSGLKFAKHHRWSHNTLLSVFLEIDAILLTLSLNKDYELCVCIINVSYSIKMYPFDTK